MDYLNDQRTEYDLALHLLRIQLDDDSYENIATNLPEEEFKAEDFKALYHLRWQEENSFRSIVTFMIMLELKLYRITLAHTSCTI